MKPPSVLGLPLEEAVALLTDAGFSVAQTELRSRKGVAGNERRVVRQRLSGDVVQLSWSLFKTDVRYCE